jgi:hypothetical protein
MTTINSQITNTIHLTSFIEYIWGIIQSSYVYHSIYNNFDKRTTIPFFCKIQNENVNWTYICSYPHCHFLIPLDKIISNKSSFIRIYMYMQLPTFSKVQIQARNSMMKNKKEKHAINQKCTKRGYFFHTLLTWTRNSISTNNNLHQMIHQVYFRQFMLNI